VILHIASVEKFLPAFINFVNKNFDNEKHHFRLLGDKNKYPLNEHVNTKVRQPTLIHAIRHYCSIVKGVNKAEKVILHGLFDSRLVILLFMMPWVLKKCYWVIWGGDLYSFQKPKIRKRDKVKEVLRSFVIKRMGYLVTYIPGDVALARDWYGAKGAYKECLMYPSNIVDEQFITNEFERKESINEAISIIVGNSADPSNNHIEILEKLVAYKNKNIRIVAPLSYGDKEHAKKVTAYGHKEFGNKFEAITDFIPLSEYQYILKHVDIAMFNHKRQQAMGNTITLLGMGKTVFLRSDVPQWSLFKGLGVNVKDINEAELFSQLVDTDSKRNIEIIKAYFNYKNLLTQYERIFTSDQL
jgi:hypothetical protein